MKAIPTWPKLPDRRAEHDAYLRGEKPMPYVDANSVCPMCKNQDTDPVDKDYYRCSCSYEWKVKDAAP